MAGTFLARLLKDTRANTLAIGAAAVIPLIGVVGGGVDASRLYLAKARLQQACDSATLAARRQLGADSLQNGEIPSDIQTTADNFFEANFSDGMYGSSELEFDLTAGSATRIDGTASVEVPTTLMTVFGIDEASLNVECSAELNLPNIDVMLVLDTSGSMAGSRISGLKNAVFAFYDEIMAVAPDEAQVRIGFVPYNSAVNVGGALVAENPDFVADSHVYQSRQARFDLISNNDGIDEGDVLTDETSTELLPMPTSFSVSPNQLGSTNEMHYHWARNNTTHQNYCRYSYNGTYWVGSERWIISGATWRNTHWGGSWPTSQRAACRATVRRQTFAGPGDVRPPTYSQVFRDYQYTPITFNTSLFKLGQTVTTQTGWQGGNVNSSWNGCIEERAPTIPTSGTTPVAGALDLDIDLVPDPSDPDTQWKPQWPQITYWRNGQATENSSSNRSLESFDCPMAAVRLQEWPLSGTSRNAAFTSYVNALNANGGTIHDGGFMWGARFISPTGIFANDNDAAPNGEPISRHIIFMTDGTMEPPTGHYTSFGNYNMDGRFFGFDSGGWTTDELRPYHLDRLAAICEDVKNKNITVWTVTFGLPQNTYTRACATGPQRAFEAASTASLIAAFRQIATSIAELRLVQ